jgi:predicted nucleic acid-binding protein
MCIIVDANVIAKVLLDADDTVYAPVRKRLFESARAVRLVYGGRLRDEYARLTEVMRRLRVLDQAARTFNVSDDEVDAEMKRVAALQECKSDDEYIIALARLSRARVLVSQDQDLHRDFKNKKLVDTSRGKLYTNASRAKLLTECSQ